jgi:hypothetical protein
MFRTKFGRIADPLFYILGGNNAFNYSKAVDKLEGYVSPIFAAISSRMQGPNKDQYGFIYRVSNHLQIKISLPSFYMNFSITEVMDLILPLIPVVMNHLIKAKWWILHRNSKQCLKCVN